MENKQNYQMNLSMPNVLNICIDENEHGEIRGRMFHCFSEEPVIFANVVELIKKAEDFFDDISFPQAATQSRSFRGKAEIKQPKRMEKVVEQAEIVEYRGALASFITIVKFRQNSTWQGELLWIERGEKAFFNNSLDFVKLVDQALIKSTKENE